MWEKYDCEQQLPCMLHALQVRTVKMECLVI